MVGSTQTLIPLGNGQLRRTRVFAACDVEVVDGTLAGQCFPMPDQMILGDTVLAKCPQPLWVHFNQTGTTHHISADSPVGRGGDRLVALGTVTLLAPGKPKTALQVLYLPDNDDLYLTIDADFEIGTEYAIVAFDQTARGLTETLPRQTGFGRGTLIELADGTSTPVDDLRTGDRVRTVDGGDAKLVWAGTRQIRAQDHDAPVIVGPDVLGNGSEMLLAPDTRVMLDNWRAEVMCGSREVLITARDLVDCADVCARAPGAAIYTSLVFDRHQVIRANGAWVESMQVNPVTFAALPAHQKTEILEIFPDIVEQPQNAALGGRMALETGQAEALLRQIGIQ